MNNPVIEHTTNGPADAHWLRVVPDRQWPEESAKFTLIVCEQSLTALTPWERWAIHPATEGREVCAAAAEAEKSTAISEGAQCGYSGSCN